MNINETLSRAGLNVEHIVKEYSDQSFLPGEYSYDAMGEESCVDSYEHGICAPEHLGDFVIAREVEHKCMGGTTWTFHMAPASVSRPHGGEIPIILCRILRQGHGGFAPQAVWDMTSEEAKKAVKGSWLMANSVAEAIMMGQLDEEWLPEGSEGGAGHMWLHKALEVAYIRDASPLPLVRRMFPQCSWEFTENHCLPNWSGFCHTGDIAWTCQVKGGWVKAILIGEDTNSPL